MMSESDLERRTLESFLTDQGLEGEISRLSPVGGGCIGDAQKIKHSLGDYFVKSMPPGRGDVLEAEALGLAALAEPGVIPVPRVLGTGTFPGGRPFLVLDWIDHNPGGKADQRSLGRNLARLHRVTHAHYGWSRNNYIGSSPQINTPVESWVQFFGLHRIGYQYELGKKTGQITGDLAGKVEKLLDRLPELIPEPSEGPSLVHGDLWGGNWVADARGQGVLIDPAVYYGHREVDLAMTEMFGGFSRDFYHGYQEEWPLTPGYQQRKQLYNLYHYLNHLNIFGSGYRGACLGIIRSYL